MEDDLILGLLEYFSVFRWEIWAPFVFLATAFLFFLIPSSLSYPKKSKSRVFFSDRGTNTQIAVRIVDFLSNASGRKVVPIKLTDDDTESFSQNEDQSSPDKRQVLIIFIGPNWHGTIPGENLLYHPNDSVRLEIEYALRHDWKIVPVFVDGVSAVDSTLLPKSINEIAKKSGLRVRPGPDFNRDVIRLLGVVRG